MRIEMLRDTVSPRLVVIRGCEYTRVKLATVYPLAPIGGPSKRVSSDVGADEGYALEAYTLMLRGCANLSMRRLLRVI